MGIGEGKNKMKKEGRFLVHANFLLLLTPQKKKQLDADKTTERVGNPEGIRLGDRGGAKFKPTLAGRKVSHLLPKGEEGALDSPHRIEVLREKRLTGKE